ncbi:MAG: SDR family oxidoreductase [Acidimicrobiales bacterium]
MIANLNDLPAYGARLADIEDDRWIEGFDAMVHPLMRLVRTVRADGRARLGLDRRDHLVVTPAADGARDRLAWRPERAERVRAVGRPRKACTHGCSSAPIAQNFVENDTYYPPSIMENERFRERLRTEVPARRLGRPHETAELALFLAGDTSTFLFGQIISNDGGWS